MVIIDIETSGLDPRKHGVISIGAVEFSDPDNTFYGECYLTADLEIDSEASAIHGFTEEQLRDETRQSSYILIKSFVEWLVAINDRTPAGLHVASFDLKFLERLADRENIAWPLGKRSIDLHSLTYTHVLKHNPDQYQIVNQRSNINGQFIQQYCGIKSVPIPHNALLDAKWESECFARLLLGRSLLPDFEHFPIPDYLQ